jgi:hypothetical protein
MLTVTEQTFGQSLGSNPMLILFLFFSPSKLYFQARGLAQEVEYLPFKWESPEVNPQYHKK